MRQGITSDGLKVALVALQRVKYEIQHLRTSIEDAMPPAAPGEGTPEKQWRRGFFIGQLEALDAAMFILDERMAIMRETRGDPLGAEQNVLFHTDISPGDRGPSRH